MTVYTPIPITPHHAGFGMYQGSPCEVSPNTSYPGKETLLETAEANVGLVLPLEGALAHPICMEYGVDDITGRIYGYNGPVWVWLECGLIGYFGIVESEVPETFYNN